MVKQGTCECTYGYTTDPAALASVQCTAPPGGVNAVSKCPGKVDIVIVIDMSVSVMLSSYNTNCETFPNDPKKCAFRAEKDFARSVLLFNGAKTYLAK